MARNVRPQSRAGLAVPMFSHLAKRPLFRVHVHTPFFASRLLVAPNAGAHSTDRRGKDKHQAKDNPATFSFCAKYPMSYRMGHLLANDDTTANFCAAMDDVLSSLSYRKQYARVTTRVVS